LEIFKDKLKLEKFDTTEYFGLLNQIKSCSHYQKEILDKVLTLQKLELNKFYLEMSIFNPLNLINSIFEMFKENEKNIIFKTEIINGKNIYLKGDCLQLKQVILNFLTNSIKFTSNDGKIIIGFKILEKKNNFANIQFKIEDNGKGMTEEQLKNLFIPFLKLSSQEVKF
jgi:two-component system, sensor histidine kinase and response regulator